MASGQWGTIQIGVPDFLESVRDAINSVAQFLASVLDIVLEALQLVKSFLVGYLDPIMAFLQQVIDYITTLLRDLRQLGLYMCGDWELMKWPFSKLRGGYRAYEQRMIGRMTDRTDVTRPDLTPNTKVFSLWFYLSADTSQIEQLIEYVKQLMRFFGHTFNPTGTPPVPVITQVLYDAEGASILQPQALGEYFKENLELPNVAVVKWKLNSTANESPFNPFPSLPPGGFIVTVSTFKDGIPIAWDRPQVAGGTEPSTENPNERVQPRDYGRVFGPTGQALVLHGGADMLTGDLDTYSYNKSLNGGKVQPNRTRVYGITSPTANTVIPLDALSEGETYNFQRTFYVPSEMVGTQFMTGEFQFALKLTDMPRNGKMEKQPDGTMKFVPSEDNATLVYARVASCTKKVADGSTPLQYRFGGPDSLPPPTGNVWTVQTPNVQTSGVSPFSAPMRITFPNANTAEYFKAVQTAMVVLILCRPDLSTWAEIEPSMSPDFIELVKARLALVEGVAAQPCGLESFAHLLSFVLKDPKKDYLAKGGTPQDFRESLFRRSNQFVYDAYNATGPMPDVERSVVLNTVFLRNVKWCDLLKSAGVIDEIPAKDFTILESIDPSKGGRLLNNGVAINRYSMGINPNTSDELLKLDGIFSLRAPQFMEVLNFPANDPTFNLDGVYQSLEELAEAKRNSPALIPFLNQARFDKDTGKYRIPSQYMTQWQLLRGQRSKIGSCDDSAPVFVINRKALEGQKPEEGGVVFCRGLFAAAKNGQILTEAAFALGVAASSHSLSSQDGAWLTYRFMDSITGIEDFMWSLQNWLESIKNTIQSIIDTIKKYIEYLEGRIIELQQFIRRINDLIQSVMQNIFTVPKCAALMLYSNGMDGMLADFISAKNKPSDSPLAFGAGVGVVIPAPLIGLIGDILMAIFDTDSDAPGDSIAGPVPPAVIIANPPQPVEPPEPDVL